MVDCQGCGVGGGGLVWVGNSGLLSMISRFEKLCGFDKKKYRFQ